METAFSLCRYGRKKVVVVSFIAVTVILNLQSVISVFSVILALRLLLGVMTNPTLYSLGDLSGFFTFFVLIHMLN